MKKVWYSATKHATRTRKGIVLRPGENEYPDAVADELLEIGLVSALPPAPETEASPVVGDQRDEETPEAAVSINPSEKEA